ncbi:MAG: VWA domain-containing protein [Planctomycetota bacterium]|nr:MAG: VWA domain-containing protein [Planctomycetota bacterium]REJ98446.1 MAG: VWA domain-containing protein [Planctomycetota bacterium]REK23639.1 MAG: VWA domain-containing protein [Planctomycetota bacterium]REK31134.1 MAG: VWA domain-containing protein [Planctomycetota bacterium]
MINWWRTIRPAAGSAGASRHTAYAVTASTCAHLCLIVLFGLIAFGQPGSPAAPAVNTVWSDPSRAADAFTTAVSLESAEAEAGGSSLARVPLVTGAADASPLADTDFRVEEPLPRANALETANLAAPVRPLGGGDGSLDNAGDGSGDGDAAGDGSGSSFFGLTAAGKKFVFVVDASGSMRRPFQGQGKTLLGRTKLEILKCVTQMDSDQQFFIVYFNDETFPMPADRLMHATKENQLNYLRWMAGFKAGGTTEPEDALLLALRLKPDVVYFLTDGAFKYRVIDRVKQMNRNKVSINTVSFGGDERAADFMQQIADQNNGSYHFVSANGEAGDDVQPVADDDSDP